MSGGPTAAGSDGMLSPGRGPAGTCERLKPPSTLAPSYPFLLKIALRFRCGYLTRVEPMTMTFLHASLSLQVFFSSLKWHIFNGLSACDEQPLGTRGIRFQDKPLWAAVDFCDSVYVYVCTHACVPMCEDTDGDNWEKQELYLLGAWVNSPWNLAINILSLHTCKAPLTYLPAWHIGCRCFCTSDPGTSTGKGLWGRICWFAQGSGSGIWLPQRYWKYLVVEQVAFS